MSDGVTRGGAEALESPVSEPSEGAMSAGGRFKPGQSGNRKGRPRQVVKDQSAIERALDEVVTFTTKKGMKKILASEGVARRLVMKALSGDIPAMKLLIAASPKFLTEVIEAGPSGESYESFIKHISDAMSIDAFREFTDAATSWQKLRVLAKQRRR